MSVRIQVEEDEFEVVVERGRVSWRERRMGRRERR
jgi:hypothetical protein